MPIPPRQYQWFVTFWHVVYLGVLALFLWLTVSPMISLGLTWPRVVLVAALAAQAGLYVKLIISNPRWPLSLRTLVLYFSGSLILWFVEWRIEPRLFWLLMSYWGQLYGLAPPALSVSGSALIFLLIAAQSRNWSSAEEVGWQIFGMFMGWLSFTILFLFIHYLGNTNQKRAKLILELQAAQKELEASRQRDAELAVLRERERLARELHDSLGHAIATLSIQLEAVQRLYKVDPDQASTQVDTLKILTRHSMDDLRRSLDGLRAPGLDDRKLSEALQSLCVETAHRLNIEIACHVAESADELSPAIAETMWRAAQEALTNVDRHARARRVQIDLSLRGDAVTLRVTDDGLGLPPDAESRPGHYGLRGMRERVEGLGGTLSLAGGGGATIEVRLPIITAASSAAGIP